MDRFPYLSNAHPDYIENLYSAYKKDAESIDQEFRKFFDGFDFAHANYSENGVVSGGVSADEFKVFKLIEAYRDRAHLVADTNPIRQRKDRGARLDLADFGLSEADLDTEFLIGEEVGLGKTTLRAIIDHLQTAYCRSIGYEFNYIRDEEEWNWLRDQIEHHPSFEPYSIEKKEDILRKLNRATVFEQFLGRKYIGEKRFSLEGGETTIPALEAIIETSADGGTREVVLGMAHRGRLNVLANIMGKTYEEIFSEFEGFEPEKTMGDGDVKYHLGFSGLYRTRQDNEVHLKLMPNPSHLEAVDPVVQGFARAKADTIYDSDYTAILPLLVHGDAAVAGQGVVYEVLQMAKLDGYSTGGTIHFVINNQIGFTTDFDDARSTDYCTSLAQAIQAPVLHINGDDIESVIFAAELAARYRQRFNKDIFLDMVCYRKHGHNESDDPKYTQPTFYKKISKHENPRDIYSRTLHEAGEVEDAMADKLDREFWQELQDRLEEVKEGNGADPEPQEPEIEWEKLRTATSKDFEKNPKTTITKTAAKEIIKALITYPDGFDALRKVEKYLKNRREIMQDRKTVDWAAAELMAYGALVREGNIVRMSGQDVKRGTFSHRHAVIYDEKTNEQFNRISALEKGDGRFMIYNSHLSEYGVLGFEFGYSLANPHALTLWEAQFGDFSNNAQVMIDQYIASSESKWGKSSGLVMLLPHGYEGQGPEHSSARLGRYLQLCAEFNLVITNITSPSNFFHALRRQVKWPFRKPLINMSPKSLLRHPEVESPIDELFSGGFRELIDDEHVEDPKTVKRLLLCSGKVYYDLHKKRREEERDDVAIVRLEQLYPLPLKALDKTVKRYGDARIIWVQEEPRNMGAWTFLLDRFLGTYDLHCVSRKTSASPATGYKTQHLKEQADLLDRAFNETTD